MLNKCTHTEHFNNYCQRMNKVYDSFGNWIHSWIQDTTVRIRSVRCCFMAVIYGCFLRLSEIVKLSFNKINNYECRLKLIWLCCCAVFVHLPKMSVSERKWAKEWHFFLHFLHNYRFFFWQDWQWITWKRKCCSGFGIFFNFLKMRHSHFTLLTITQYRDELIFCRLEIAFHFISFSSWSIHWSYFGHFWQQ